MAVPRVGPTLTQGRFSQRVSNPIGGNEHAGPWQGFPMWLASKRRYWEYFNDFNSRADLDVQNFEWNRTDGSASAYAAGTAIARVADWIPAEIGSASTTTDPNTVATLIGDQSYGLMRVDAGTSDSTGGRVYRALAGANVSELLPLDRSGTIAAGEFRFRFTETGTAGQSAIYLGWTADDQATLTTAGAQTGTGAGSIYFVKVLASTSLIAGMTGSANTSNTLTVGTMASATWYTLGWRYKATATSAGNASMDVYLNGVLVGSAWNTSTTHVPAAQQYSPHFAVVNGVGCDTTLDIDYVSAVTERL